MPLNPNGELKNLTLVLTKDQVQRLQQLATLRSTKFRKIGVSDVGREVVEAGLVSVIHGTNTSSIANTTEIESRDSGKAA